MQFEELLDAQGIRYESRGSGDSAWWSILTYLLPFALFFGFWIFLMQRVQGKGRDGRKGDSEGEARGEAGDTGTQPDTYR